MARNPDLEVVVPSVSAALGRGDAAAASALVCQVLRSAEQPPSALYHYRAFLVLCLLAKRHLAAFDQPATVRLLTARLRSSPEDAGAAPAPGPLGPPRGAASFPHLCAFVLMELHRDRAAWPVDFVEEYLRDALGPRAWVDSPYAAEFVAHLRAAFPPVPGPGGHPPVSDGGGGPPTPNHYPDGRQQLEIENRLQTVLATSAGAAAGTSAKVTKQVMQAIVPLLGYPVARQFAAERMEAWLSHPSHSSFAVQILTVLCECVTTDKPADVAALDALVRMRPVKHLPSYSELLAGLVARNAQYTARCFEYFLAQELLPTRSPATLKQFAGLWRALPGAGHEAALAAAVHALAADPQRLPHIPALLRRLCRACLPRWNVHDFCLPMLLKATDLLNALSGVNMGPAREALQGRLLLLLDLVALAVAVSLAAQWQLDGAARHTAAEPGHSALEQLPLHVATLQDYGMAWVRRWCGALRDGLRLPRPALRHIVALLLFQRFDFLVLPERLDPSDKAQLTRDLNAIPLLPDTVLHVVALSTEHRLMSHPEALELVEVMVGRCAEFHKHLGVDAVLPVPPVTDHLALHSLLSLAHLDPLDLELAEAERKLRPADAEYGPVCELGQTWKACTLAAVLCSLHPPALAFPGWQRLPLLRRPLAALAAAFHPPIDAVPAPPAPAPALLAYAGRLAVRYAAAGVPHDNSAADLAGRLLPVEALQQPLVPPAEAMGRLCDMDAAWGLGMRLRRCVDPPLFPAIIADQPAVPWLRLLLRHDPPALARLPPATLVALLLGAGADPEVRPDLPRLLGPVAARLFGPPAPTPDDAAASLEVLHHLLRTAASPVWREQSAARRLLRQLLAVEGAAAEEAVGLADGAGMFHRLKGCPGWHHPRCPEVLWGSFVETLRHTADGRYLVGLLAFVADLAWECSSGGQSGGAFTTLSICEALSRAMLDRRRFFHLMAADAAFHSLAQTLFVACVRWAEAAGPPAADWVACGDAALAIHLPEAVVRGVQVFISAIPAGSPFTSDFEQAVLLPLTDPVAPCHTASGEEVALEPAVWPALALADLPLLAGRALEEMGPGPLMGLLAGPGPPGLPSRVVAQLAQVDAVGLYDAYRRLPAGQQRRVQAHLHTLHRRGDVPHTAYLLTALGDGSGDGASPAPGRAARELAPARSRPGPPPLSHAFDSSVAGTAERLSRCLSSGGFDVPACRAVVLSVSGAPPPAEGWAALRAVFALLAETATAQAALQSCPGWLLAAAGAAAKAMPDPPLQPHPAAAWTALEGCAETAAVAALLMGEPRHRRWATAFGALPGWSSPGIVEELASLLALPLLGQLFRTVAALEPLPRAFGLFHALHGMQSEVALLLADESDAEEQLRAVSRLVFGSLARGSEAGLLVLAYAPRAWPALGCSSAQLAEACLLGWTAGSSEWDMPTSTAKWADTLASISLHGTVLDALQPLDLCFRAATSPEGQGRPRVAFGAELPREEEAGLFEWLLAEGEGEDSGRFAWRRWLLAKLRAHLAPHHLLELVAHRLTPGAPAPTGTLGVEVLAAHTTGLAVAPPTRSSRRGLWAGPAGLRRQPPAAKDPPLFSLRGPDRPPAAPLDAAGLADALAHALPHGAAAAGRVLLWACGDGRGPAAARVAAALRDRVRAGAGRPAGGGSLQSGGTATTEPYAWLLAFLYHAFPAIAVDETAPLPMPNSQLCCNSVLDADLHACLATLAARLPAGRSAAAAAPTEDAVAAAAATLHLVAQRHPGLLMRHVPPLLALLSAVLAPAAARFHEGRHAVHRVVLRTLQTLGPARLQDGGQLLPAVEHHLLPGLRRICEGDAGITVARQEYADKYQLRYASAEERARRVAAQQQAAALEAAALDEALLHTVQFLVGCVERPTTSCPPCPAAVLAVLRRAVPTLEQVQRRLQALDAVGWGRRLLCLVQRPLLAHVVLCADPPSVDIPFPLSAFLVQPPASDDEGPSLTYNTTQVAPLEGHLRQLGDVLQAYAYHVGCPGPGLGGLAPVLPPPPSSADLLSPFAEALVQGMAREDLLEATAGEIGLGEEAFPPSIATVREALHLLETLLAQEALRPALEELAARRSPTLPRLAGLCGQLLLQDVDEDEPQDPMLGALAGREPPDLEADPQEEQSVYAAVWESCLGVVQLALSCDPALYSAAVPPVLAALATARDSRHVAVKAVPRLFPYAREFKRPLLQALWRLAAVPPQDDHEPQRRLRAAAGAQLRTLLAGGLPPAP